jgi:iron complex transport system substrate-binding protein
VPLPRGRRVVAAGYLRDTDLALALGVPLAGAARNASFASGLAPWQRAPAGQTLFGTANGMPFERVAALHPDLIMASDDYTLTKDYASLVKIAPTLSYLQGVGADGWQTMTTRAGTVLGKSGKAATLIASVQDQIAKARAGNAGLAGQTFTFGPVSGMNSVYTINDPADASAAFFGQLGMKLSPKVTRLPASSTPRRARLSVERLGVLDADVVILAYPDAGIRARFERQAVFKQLSAVRRGAYIALDLAAAIAVAFPSVLSIPYGLQVLVPKLAAAARNA